MISLKRGLVWLKNEKIIFYKFGKDTCSRLSGHLYEDVVSFSVKDSWQIKLCLFSNIDFDLRSQISCKDRGCILKAIIFYILHELYFKKESPISRSFTIICSN